MLRQVSALLYWALTARLGEQGDAGPKSMHAPGRCLTRWAWRIARMMIPVAW